MEGCTQCPDDLKALPKYHAEHLNFTPALTPVPQFHACFKLVFASSFEGAVLPFLPFPCSFLPFPCMSSTDVKPQRDRSAKSYWKLLFFFLNYIFPELTWNLFNAVIEKKHQKWDEPCTMHEMIFINKLNLQQEALLKITIQIAIISFSLLFTLVIFIWSFIYCSCLTVLYVNEYIECFWIYICWT